MKQAECEMVRFKTDPKNKSPFVLNYKALFIISITVMALFRPGSAQDSHYWTYQYGARSTFLGGAVIGSVLDLSGTYYNPGGLALIEDPETLLATKVFHYPRITLENVGETNIDLDSSGLSTAPGLLAGQLKFKWLKKHRLMYSILTRQDVEYGITGSFVGSRDAMNTEENEALVGRVELSEKLSEPWVGLTWAYQIHKNIGIGISQYVMVRSHKSNRQVIIEALPAGDDMIMAIDAMAYNYKNYRLLWKLGLAFDFDRITLGLTVTTPSLKLYGRGSANINVAFSGRDLDGDGIEDNWLAASYQDGLDSDYYTPLSVGIGATYKFQNTKIYGSAEWFDEVEKFEVLKTEDFPSQSPGDTVDFRVTHELDSVLNYALGIEHSFSERFAVYASFTTDFSAKKPDSDTNLSLTDWDIYQIMAGTSFTFKKSQFTLGVGYAYGSRGLGQRLDPFEKEVFRDLLEQLSEAEYTYSNIKFVLGFSF